MFCGAAGQRLPVSDVDDVFRSYHEVQTDFGHHQHCNASWRNARVRLSCLEKDKNYVKNYYFPSVRFRVSILHMFCLHTAFGGIKYLPKRTTETLTCCEWDVTFKSIIIIKRTKVSLQSIDSQYVCVRVKIWRGTRSVRHSQHGFKKSCWRQRGELDKGQGRQEDDQLEVTLTLTPDLGALSYYCHLCLD